MDEKTILIKAAYAAVRQMDACAKMPVTYGTAVNSVFNAILQSGTVAITEADVEALREVAEKESADGKR